MSERPLHTPALSPEERRLIDACMDSTLQGNDAARAEELTRTNPAFSAELEAQRSMIASLRAPSGRIDVTASVLDAIHEASPFVEIERRHRRARHRTAACVSVLLAVGGIVTLQAMYPELSDFGAGPRPISTLTEAGRRDAVDGAQAVASAVGTITQSLVSPASEPARRSSPRRPSLGLGDTSAYEPSPSWHLTAANSAPSGVCPVAWSQPCNASMSVAWQAPSIVTIRGGDLPTRGITWVGGWKYVVPGLPPEDQTPRR